MLTLTTDKYLPHDHKQLKLKLDIFNHKKKNSNWNKEPILGNLTETKWN